MVDQSQPSGSSDDGQSVHSRPVANRSFLIASVILGAWTGFLIWMAFFT